MKFLVKHLVACTEGEREREKIRVFGPQVVEEVITHVKSSTLIQGLQDSVQGSVVEACESRRRWSVKLIVLAWSRHKGCFKVEDVLKGLGAI